MKFWLWGPSIYWRVKGEVEDVAVGWEQSVLTWVGWKCSQRKNLTRALKYSRPCETRTRSTALSEVRILKEKCWKNSVLEGISFWIHTQILEIIYFPSCDIEEKGNKYVSITIFLINCILLYYFLSIWRLNNYFLLFPFFKILVMAISSSYSFLPLTILSGCVGGS